MKRNNLKKKVQSKSKKQKEYFDQEEENLDVLEMN